MFLCVFEDCYIYFSNEFEGEKNSLLPPLHDNILLSL